MPTVVGMVAETRPGERRTALVPRAVASLVASEFRVLVEAGCGVEAGFADRDFASSGAEIVESDELYRRSQVIACVNATRRSAQLHRGQIMLGMLQPWRHPMLIEHWARRGVTMVSLDRAPRLPEARGMNPTLTQARIAGREAVLLAEEHFGGSFPMIASNGAVRPVSVLVLGAGAVGLQAMSSALLLDADVTGCAGRAGERAAIAARGARFLDVGGALFGGADLSQEVSDRQRLARRHALDVKVSQFDVVITAVGSPGSRPPRLVSAAAVADMRPGSVIVDAAASRYGGNVIGSRPGTTVTVPPGVRLIGAENLPSRTPGLASEYYADNVVMALRRLCATGEPRVALSDPVWSATVLGYPGRPVQLKPATPLPAPTTANPTPARAGNGQLARAAGRE